MAPAFLCTPELDYHPGMFGPIDGIGMGVLVGILLLILLARYAGWGTGIWPPKQGPF